MIINNNSSIEKIKLESSTYIYYHMLYFSCMCTILLLYLYSHHPFAHQIWLLYSHHPSIHQIWLLHGPSISIVLMSKQMKFKEKSKGQKSNINKPLFHKAKAKSLSLFPSSLSVKFGYYTVHQLPFSFVQV